MNPNVMELSLLRVCESSESGEWSGTFGALRNRLREMLGVEPPNSRLIAEAITELDRVGELEARKYESLDPIRLQEATSVETFFFYADFRMRLTYAGRKRLTELAEPEPPKEPIGFRPA